MTQHWCDACGKPIAGRALDELAFKLVASPIYVQLTGGNGIESGSEIQALDENGKPLVLCLDCATPDRVTTFTARTEKQLLARVATWAG